MCLSKNLNLLEKEREQDTSEADVKAERLEQEANAKQNLHHAHSLSTVTRDWGKLQI